MVSGKVASQSYRQYEGRNEALIALLDPNTINILDVGCGVGGNASPVKNRCPTSKVCGITISHEEAAAARQQMDEVVVADLEEGVPEQLRECRYDAIICSHVVEHLSRPSRLVAVLTGMLKPDGALLIAVPNVAYWRQRIELLKGRFNYTQGGIMDETHLRFFTFYSAQQYLLKDTSGFRVTRTISDGHCPLGWLRKYVLPEWAIAGFDRGVTRLLPNVFGWQILIEVRRVG